MKELSNTKTYSQEKLLRNKSNKSWDRDREKTWLSPVRRLFHAVPQSNHRGELVKEFHLEASET
jgi:hypothetical protein